MMQSVGEATSYFQNVKDVLWIDDALPYKPVSKVNPEGSERRVEVLSVKAA